jgi:cytochrome P450
LDLQTEELFQPPTGLFLPWTSGPRICPGRKFAQVEFVAVIAKLFQKHEVEPVLEHDETMKQARQRALDQANHSIVNMTLQMADPKNVKLAWKEVSIEKERRVRWEMA